MNEIREAAEAAALALCKRIEADSSNEVTWGDVKIEALASLVRATADLILVIKQI